jgi:hypothetical protein
VDPVAMLGLAAEPKLREIGEQVAAELERALEAAAT